MLSDVVAVSISEKKVLRSPKDLEIEPNLR